MEAAGVAGESRVAAGAVAAYPPVFPPGHDDGRWAAAESRVLQLGGLAVRRRFLPRCPVWAPEGP